MTYFVSNKSDGCWYYRCYIPMLYHGCRGDKISLGSEKIVGKASSDLAIASDIVVFQRPDDRDRLETALMLKKLGKKIVFENDDTYKDNDPMKFERLDGSLSRKIENLDDFIKIADLVTTTTEFLADEYRKLNKNVVVLKNLIDPIQWSIPKRNSGDVVRVGLFGSTTLNGDFEPISGLLKELSDRPDVQLVMMGLPANNLRSGAIKEVYKEELEYWSKLNVEIHPLVGIKDYFKGLNDLELDIALIPRRDNYFNRCKSNLKFLEAGMLEIPVVAQVFEDGNSPYEEILDGEIGMKALNEQEFKDKLELLIKNKDYRIGMGRMAKEYVLKNYDARKYASQWKEAFKNLL
ncbi:MAG: hypothetical protein WCH76_08035 [Candidatus Riflemargulisbacteria bacterium]